MWSKLGFSPTEYQGKNNANLQVVGQSYVFKFFIKTVKAPKWYSQQFAYFGLWGDGELAIY